ncbi:MAG: BamA/TamA family outer membrane protein, partial [Planctomycetota bacterium]|nr:BamA/TamA family outer membrane protein [Planctomycetota bacterium]
MTRYYLLLIGLSCLGCAAAHNKVPDGLSPSQLGYRRGVLPNVDAKQSPLKSPGSADEEVTVRGQSPETARDPWSGTWDGRRPMPASSAPPVSPRVAQADSLWTAPGSQSPAPPTNAWGPGPGYTPAGPTGRGVPPTTGYPSTSPGYGMASPGYSGQPGSYGASAGAPLPPPSAVTPDPSPLGGGPLAWPDGRIPADLVINVEETTTGRFMIGAGVNSDAGVTGQVTIDEQNFDWRRYPRSFDQIIDGTAFRGAGQRLRIEAMPGTRVQRYMVNFVEPYLWDTPVSLSLSGFLFDRNYFDWDERRLGGRAGLGYRLTPDLSVNVAGRGENVNIRNPRVRGVTALEEVLGDNELWSGKVTVTHDTRDVPFFPTTGHMLELSYEQAFGDFDFPHATIDYRRYHLLMERPDSSGRHVWGNSIKFGFAGSDTPVFENFFAGGSTTMRGFSFRGASPMDSGVIVGGTFSILGSSEYFIPITADDMLK